MTAKLAVTQSLARVLHGTLDEHWDELVRLNRAGAGVFVTVNETDLKGRKKENITRIRALWQEADRGDEPTLPFEPHITVESSPGKYHRYVLVEGAPLERVRGVQQRLVDDYGSDPNAKDISRVLRLPGFYHMKNPANPHMVRILEESGEPPTWSWARAGQFPPLCRPRACRARRRSCRSWVLRSESRRDRFGTSPLDPDMGYQQWLQVGMALHSTGAGQEAFELWDQWSQGGSTYREGECAYRWGTFAQAGGVTMGTLFHMRP